MTSMMNIFGMTFFTLIMYVESADSVRILVLPVPVHSHCNALASVGEAMVKRGHSVFVYIPTNFNSIPCLEGRGMTTIPYTMKPEDWDHLKEVGRTIREVPDQFLHTTKYICRAFFQKHQLEKLLSQKFDFAIVDPFYGARCLLYFVNKNSIPYATVAPMYELNENGSPFIPNIDPRIATGFSPAMTLPQRTLNTIFNLLSSFVMDYMTTGEISRDFLPEVPISEYRKLVQNKALLFIKEDSVILSGALPVTPNTVYTGGFSVKPSKPLPQKLQSFFDGAIKGVIVVSFGSIGATIGSTLELFESVFPSLPYRILWKAEGSSNHENILLSNWIPQNDALGHKHTKLFITHCGLNGVFEGIYHEVPMLCFPQFGDHFKYAEIVQRKKFGLYMDAGTLTEENLKEAITRVLDDKTMRSNLKKSSVLYRDMHYLPANEIAARAVEHVIKFGGEHIRPMSLDMSYISFIVIDVWFVILSIVSILIMSLCFFLRCLWFGLRKNKVKNE